MTERVSGIVILLALAAIIVPWLMSDPAPREERPRPNLTIEQPIDVERRDVPRPEIPASVEQLSTQEQDVPAIEQPVEIDPIEVSPREPESTAPETAQPEPTQPRDPIAELVAANETSGANDANAVPSASSQGDWAVQVGSFGNPDNVERLTEQLESQGLMVYQRQREGNLTTVFVGPFDTAEEGEQAMLAVKQRANLQGLLVRVKE
ncbi:SPOR domain-containing protein [Vreelandella rituensis]|nr:SPOR domain-containing protein [Halomonas rituensis]